LRLTDAPATGTYASYPWLTPFSFLEKYAFLSSEQGADAATTVEVEERDLRWASDYSDADLSCVYRATYLTPVTQVSTPSSRAQDKDGRLAVLFWALC
jgi:hypothetical protein